MNSLSQYILEKLHIDKDIKIIGENNIVSNILNWCDIRIPKYHEINYNGIKHQLDEWVRQNNVDVVDMYAEDNKQTQEHVEKLSKEISNVVHLINFDDFHDLFIGAFPEGTNFDDIILYKSGGINICGNEKALSAKVENLSLLVVKLK